MFYACEWEKQRLKYNDLIPTNYINTKTTEIKKK